MAESITNTPTIAEKWSSPPTVDSSAEGALRDLPELVIEPERGWPRIDVRELWAYRTLLYFLVWRDLKVRYAQTVMGIGWAVLQPLLTTLIFTVIFGRLARVPSDGVPYPVFALAALVPWTYFSASFTASSNSLLTNVNLITKVYFPRLVIPIAPVLAGLVDLAIGLVLLVGAMLIYGVSPTVMAPLLVVPLVVLLAVTAGGVGSWLAALNIQYRDVKHLTPFLVQLWMYASPIVYPMSIVPRQWRPLYALNPLVGAIEGFRAVMLGTTAVPWLEIGISAVSSALILITGTHYFRRTERIFADVA